MYEDVRRELHVDLSQMPPLYSEPRSTTVALCIVDGKRAGSWSLLPPTCQLIPSFTIGCVNSARPCAAIVVIVVVAVAADRRLHCHPTQARCIVNDNRCIRLYGGWLVNPLRPILAPLCALSPSSSPRSRNDQTLGRQLHLDPIVYAPTAADFHDRLTPAFLLPSHSSTYAIFFSPYPPRVEIHDTMDWVVALSGWQNFTTYYFNCITNKLHSFTLRECICDFVLQLLVAIYSNKGETCYFEKKICNDKLV